MLGVGITKGGAIYSWGRRGSFQDLGGIFCRVFATCYLGQSLCNPAQPHPATEKTDLPVTHPGQRGQNEFGGDPHSLRRGRCVRQNGAQVRGTGAPFLSLLPCQTTKVAPCCYSTGATSKLGMRHGNGTDYHSRIWPKNQSEEPLPPHTQQDLCHSLQESQGTLQTFNNP